MKMNLMIKWVPAIVATLLVTTSLMGQELDSIRVEDVSLDDLIEMDLDALMNLSINVASGGLALTQRESPGIITVVTSEEIKRRGLRDLKEILQFVPGFEFLLDLQGVRSVAIRGNWASEGKVLLLIDGIDVNDEMYASIAFGQHFSADMIERVEIIRGPGSVQYGGAAEMAVVSVITKSPSKELNVNANGYYSRTEKMTGRTGGNVFLGTKSEKGNVSAFISMEQGNYSDRTLQDIYGANIDLSDDDNGSTKVSNALVKAEYGGFTINAFYDNYYIQFPYPTYDVPDYHTEFISYAAKVSYLLDISPSLRLNPAIQYKQQKPWNANEVLYSDGSVYADWQIDDRSEKYSLDIPVDVDINDDVKLLSGVTYDFIIGRDYLSLTYNGDNYTDSYAGAVYAQLIARTGVGTFTAGFRGNNNENYGNSIVPRLAYTGTISKDLDLKLLLSGAQRDPAILSVATNPDIKPEFTWITETELGYHPMSDLWIQGNLFWMQIRDAIIYTWDGSAGENLYLNSKNMGSYGAELSVRYKWKDISVISNYSFARNWGAVAENFRDPLNPDRKLGIAEHKATLSMSYRAFNRFNITPSLRFVGERTAIWADYGYEYDALGNWIPDFQYKKLDRVYMLDLVLNWDSVFFDEVGFTVGAYNILNENYEMAEAYDGYDTPLPGSSREFSGKIAYNF
ncbi:MAG: TonB-dependent receptor plug domain-containing protein [Fibrobacterales bacterium]